MKHENKDNFVLSQGCNDPYHVHGISSCVDQPTFAISARLHWERSFTTFTLFGWIQPWLEKLGEAGVATSFRLKHTE